MNVGGDRKLKARTCSPRPRASGVLATCYPETMEGWLSVMAKETRLWLIPF